VYLYEKASRTLIFEFKADNNIRAVHLNNKYLYFGEKDTGIVHRVTLENLAMESKQIATDDIREIDSRKGRMIIASNDNTVYLIRERDWKIYTTFNAENNAEVALIESKYIIYASDKQKSRLHDRKPPYALVAVLTEPTGDITAVDRDGKFLFVSTDDGLIHVYENLIQAEVIPASANKARVEHIWVDRANDVFYASHGGSDFSGFSGDKEICEYNY
jgi:WD40 repeat protein